MKMQTSGSAKRAKRAKRAAHGECMADALCDLVPKVLAVYETRQALKRSASFGHVTFHAADALVVKVG